MSCEPLREQGLVTADYGGEIVECIEEFGPYIVIIPGVAMPHSTQSSINCLGTGISLTIFAHDVEFDSGDEEKRARLFFTLAAKNNEDHLKNIQNLMDLLMDEGIVERLLDVNDLEAYQRLMNEIKTTK